ncbi:MAG: DUF1799 domain-containing protein [Paracoccaceae bacterium]|nr:DUF1799 domain-containing protein [Paracoccaceae bacterium]
MADARLWGIDPALIVEEAQDTGVWPQNAGAVRAFLAVCSQWRMVALASGAVFYAGLDYGGAQAGLALAGIEASPELWAEVRVIEAGALGQLNRRGR